VSLSQLLDRAAALGVDVEWADLGDLRRGLYHDDHRLIVLNSRLTGAQATATLAHEIGHAAFGDRSSTPRAERRASEYGAALVIAEQDYRRAESLVGSHPGALADELGVTPHLVEAWRCQWEHRRGWQPAGTTDHRSHAESSAPAYRVNRRDPGHEVTCPSAD
jgi:hypothetical protein